ncbi:apolipoprotein A-IV-like [Chenopodium quinoa]|uniref:apolipoprotein A-IV-like n=1 Tax=Chenopodium quinoa TaxID=63459 RepID=UPI000B789DDE|nr:apolipoprotein A-IV-like [Chenopodium quinoa]
MVKRPAGDIPLPAAKVLKMSVPPPAKTIPKQPAGGRPTTGGKSLSGIVPTIEVVDEGVKEPVAPAGQTQTGTGSNAAGGDSTPQSDEGMTFAFDPPWPLGPMRAKTQACQSGDSSGSHQNIGEAYAQHLTDKSLIADATSSRPNYQQYAKRMIRTLIRTEKEAVPAVHTVNIDRITSLLAEVMLRIDGLQVPLRKKQEEVTDAQRRASELIDVSQYNAIRYDLETKRRELEQEELLKQIIAAAEAEKARADGLALKVNDLQADLKALEGADKENADLRADVNRLKNELASSQAAHKEELKKEQSRLIAENETDNEERMKLAWGLIHPDYDYEFFDLRYKYASEEWAGLVEEEQQEDEQMAQTQQPAQEQVQEQQQPEQQLEQQQQQEQQ